jgi:hypothetical protein
MARCITCGAQLHPERAQKYDYCMAPACQEKNAKPLTMVAVGMNKAADELMILDERTRANLASGRYADQRRGFFGQLDRAPAPAASPATDEQDAAKPATAEPVTGTPGAAKVVTGSPATDKPVTGSPGAARRPGRPRPSRAPAARGVRRPWSRSQERLALLYNEQGLRPGEIAQKLGLSSYTVTQMILSARNRGKA